MTKSAIPRFKKADWIAIGHTLLKNQGADALTLERLCNEAGRTRGSFYHHFEDHDAFLLALAELWQQTSTLSIIDEASAPTGADERLETLNMLASGVDMRLEIAMRELAVREVPVGAIVTNVDRLRLSFLEGLYHATGKQFAISARRIAELEYAAFLGAMMLWPDRDTTEREALNTAFATLLSASKQV